MKLWKLLFVLLLFSIRANAQLYLLLNLDSCYKISPYIFEGTVLNKDTCFVAGKNGNIYTAHTVKITEIIKGRLNCGNVQIITAGGTVDSITEYTGLLNLYPGNQGIFMCDINGWGCDPPPAPKENPTSLWIVADRQSYLPYWRRYKGLDFDDTLEVLYIKDDTIHFFKSHQDAFNWFQAKVGHGYVNCGPAEDDTATSFVYYPNPASDAVTLKIPGNSPASVVLFDRAGRLVNHLSGAENPFLPLKLNGYQTQIVQTLNISSLRNGIYQGQVITKDKSYPLKIIKL